jgi:hypothetical protein
MEVGEGHGLGFCSCSWRGGAQGWIGRHGVDDMFAHIREGVEDVGEAGRGCIR